MGLLDKVKQWIGQNADKVDKGVDAAAQKADEATGGKYSDKITQAAEKTRGYVEDSTGQQAGETGAVDGSEQQGSTESEPPQQQTKPESGSTN